MLAVACLSGSYFGHSQEADNVPSAPPATERILGTDTPTDAVIVTKTVPKQSVRSEIAIMGMIPDGDYRLFSATVRCTAWTVGVEYDRHSWGHFLRSDVDYVVEVMPFVLMSQPTVSDFWGNAKSPYQEHVPGLSITPFGFRFLWRKDKAIRFYTVGKLGAIAFTSKAFSQNASYANFNVQAAFGVQIRLNERIDLRVEPFEFFHVSNGYLAASNPGMDQLATRYGISYHLGRRCGSCGR
jgi:Lipid A 3-O-deacylase (PagL)